jgi:membrane-associated phospholipid phosphatase
MKNPPRYSTPLVISISIACVLTVGYAMPTGRRGIGYATLGLLSICCRWLFAKRKSSLWLLIPGIFLVLFYVWRSALLSHSAPSGMHKVTFDLYALYVDGSFGVQPSIWTHHLCTSRILRGLLQGIYEGLPFAMGIAYASFLENHAKAVKVFGCFLLAGVLAMLCYRLLPICGPAYLPFGDECFYFDGSCSTASFFSGTPSFINIDSQWPRNGMPSLHMGWALLIWWSCREKRIGRWLALIFALLTAVSTMVYGEHYLIDLLAAFFFSLIPWSLCVADETLSQSRRAVALAAGALGYLAWVVLIRDHGGLFWASPVIPWASLVISCVVPLMVVFW